MDLISAPPTQFQKQELLPAGTLCGPDLYFAQMLPTHWGIETGSWERTFALTRGAASVTSHEIDSTKYKDSMYKFSCYFDGPYIYKIYKGIHVWLCFLVGMLRVFSYLEVTGLKDSLIVFFTFFLKKATLIYFLSHIKNCTYNTSTCKPICASASSFWCAFLRHVNTI